MCWWLFVLYCRSLLSFLDICCGMLDLCWCLLLFAVVARNMPKGNTASKWQWYVQKYLRKYTQKHAKSIPKSIPNSIPKVYPEVQHKCKVRARTQPWNETKDISQLVEHQCTPKHTRAPYLLNFADRWWLLLIFVDICLYLVISVDIWYLLIFLDIRWYLLIYAFLFYLFTIIVGIC